MRIPKAISECQKKSIDSKTREKMELGHWLIATTGITIGLWTLFATLDWPWYPYVITGIAAIAWIIFILWLFSDEDDDPPQRGKTRGFLVIPSKGTIKEIKLPSSAPNRRGTPPPEFRLI